MISTRKKKTAKKPASVQATKGNSSGIRVDSREDPEDFKPLQPTGPGPIKLNGQTVYRVVVVETVTHELEIVGAFGDMRDEAKKIIDTHHSTIQKPGKIRERTVVVQHIF